MYTKLIISPGLCRRWTLAYEQKPQTLADNISRPRKFWDYLRGLWIINIFTYLHFFLLCLTLGVNSDGPETNLRNKILICTVNTPFLSFKEHQILIRVVDMYCINIPNLFLMWTQEISWLVVVTTDFKVNVQWYNSM